MEINFNKRVEANIKRMLTELVEKAALRSDELDIAERLIRLIFDNPYIVEIRKFKEIWKFTA